MTNNAVIDLMFMIISIQMLKGTGNEADVERIVDG
ncbi:hypothetical protein J2W46_005894 [Paraburkholderia strydomiana]|nr:hypothetical protein [Paraburkholderia strydomiana]